MNNTQNPNDNIICFLDPIGRTLFSEKIPERTTDDELVVKNPVVVHIGGQDGGKMTLQLLPVFFKEFLANKDDDIIFTYKKTNIALADPTTFDDKLYNNYKQMFSPIIMPQQGNITTGGKAIDLFDEKTD